MLRLPDHGGDIAWASAAFGIPECEWLDLSTGVSPWPWPVADWPARVFRDLPPQSLVVLQQVAAEYYGCMSDKILPVPGSQYAISLIPRLLSPATVAVAQVGYQEHGQAWQRAGHRIRCYEHFEQLKDWLVAGEVDHVVLINPNNPSAERITKAELLNLQRLLVEKAQQPSLMLVDEAFMDVDPEHSLAGSELSNTIVLRSFGKFFGLAGVRLGFVIDHSQLWLEKLKELTGPWLISHPAAWVAQQALQDRSWISLQRQRINTASDRLMQLLTAYFDSRPYPSKCYNGRLFVTAKGETQTLYQVFLQLAEQGILVRYGQFNQRESWLRVGLSTDFRRLQSALNILR